MQPLFLGDNMSMYSERAKVPVFLSGALILYSLVVLIPLGLSLFYSTLDWNGYGKMTFQGFGNYVELFQDRVFRKSVWNSFLLALFSVCIEIPISLMLALILASNRVKKEGFFRTVYFIPVLLSSVVIGQLWLKIYSPKYGMLNDVLTRLGGETLIQNWLGSPDVALWAVFTPILWQYIGYHMLLLYAAIRSLPMEIKEAASIDGATGIQQAVRIIIPMIRPMLQVSLIFAVTGSFKFFDLIYVMTNGGPLHATEVPSTYMYSMIFNRTRYGSGSAIALFIVVECLLFTLIIQRLFSKSKDGELA